MTRDDQITKIVKFINATTANCTLAANAAAFGHKSDSWDHYVTRLEKNLKDAEDYIIKNELGSDKAVNKSIIELRKIAMTLQSMLVRGKNGKLNPEAL